MGSSDLEPLGLDRAGFFPVTPGGRQLRTSLAVFFWFKSGKFTFGVSHMAKRVDLRILLVEDRAVMLKILRRLLVQLGFETIDQAANGTKALEKIQSSTYDLILSDWNMDGMSGFELLKLVRANTATASVPFILVTAESKPENILAAKAAGASAYLLKPFKLDMLETTIEHVLGANDFLASISSKSATIAAG